MLIKNEILFNPQFSNVWQKLLSLDINADISVRLKMSNSIIKEQSVAVFTTRDELLKKYGKLDENGNLVKDENSIEFKSVEDKISFIEQLNKLTKDTFELPIKEKIEINKNEKVSALFLELLEDIVYVEQSDINE